MKKPAMIYRAGGPHNLCGVMVEYKTVESESINEQEPSEYEKALDDGWVDSPQAAAEAAKAANAKPKPRKAASKINTDGDLI